MGAKRVKQGPGGRACADYEWLIGPYLDGELPKGEARGLETHLEDCQECRTLAEQFRNLDRLARSAAGPLPDVSPREWGEMWGNMQRRSVPASVFQERRIWDWLVPALSVAALLILGIWLGATLFQGNKSQLQKADPRWVHYEEDSTQNARPEIQIDEDVILIDFSG